MSLAKHNKSNIKWNIETKDFEYKKAMDLKVGKEYPFYGCFITSDKGYGEGAVIITDEFFVNAPGSFVDNIREIIADPESVDAINEHTEKFKVEHYETDKGCKKGQTKTCARIVLI